MINADTTKLVRDLRAKHELKEKRPKHGTADASDPQKLAAYYELHKAYRQELRVELRKLRRESLKATLGSPAAASGLSRRRRRRNVDPG